MSVEVMKLLGAMDNDKVVRITTIVRIVMSTHKSLNKGKFMTHAFLIPANSQENCGSMSHFPLLFTNPSEE